MWRTEVKRVLFLNVMLLNMFVIAVSLSYEAPPPKPSVCGWCVADPDNMYMTRVPWYGQHIHQW
jgi:hypothetical protein